MFDHQQQIVIEYSSTRHVLEISASTLLIHWRKTRAVSPPSGLHFPCRTQTQEIMETRRACPVSDIFAHSRSRHFGSGDGVTRLLRFHFLVDLLLNLSLFLRLVGGPSAGMRESIVTPFLSGSVSEDNIAITKSLKARALASGIWSPGEEEGNKTNSKHRAMPLLRATPSLLNSDPLVHHCSPKMWKIISSANPLMSFAELRQTLGLTSGEVSDII